jgi:ribosomal protein S18 acetylase RimI-like enzyme
LPFRTADVDAVVGFCVAHGSPHDGALVGRLLGTMTSGPAGVLLWGDDAGPAIAGVVIDRAINAAGAASVEVLGVRRALSPDELWELIVAPALAFARGGSSRALHVSLYPWLVDVAGGEKVLQARGFLPIYASLTMRRTGEEAIPDVPALETGWRWAPFEEHRIDEAHGAIALAFAEAPSFSLSPLEDFRRTIASAPDLWQALLDGERIAGMVRVVGLGPGAGKVGMVARVPAYRGRGLGPHLVARGLRMLAERGARDVTIDVEAANDRALDLYRSFGFRVVTRTPVLGLELRPD